MSPHRNALTMIEITMATALFAIVLAITIESLTSVRRFVNGASMEDSLRGEAARVLRLITDDLANSAWMIAPPTNNEVVALSDPINFPDYDRNDARYYPYVVVQDYETATAGDAIEYAIDGMPNDSHWYQFFKRPVAEILRPDELLLDKPNLPDDHLGPSQEVIFLKVSRVATASNEPALLASEWINFNQDANPSAPMEAYNNPDMLPVLPSMILAESGNQVEDMPLNWETWPAADIFDEAAMAFNPDQIRHYTYALVPDNRYGSRLERRFWQQRDLEGGLNGGGAVYTDVVLSDLVDRIVIDTYRTSSDLSVNQIRVRLWLSRRSDDNPLIPTTYYAESTIALRSTVDPEYSLSLGDWLGRSGSSSILP